MFTTPDLNFEYDKETDTLYCSFGMPVEAISIPCKEGVFVRQDIDTEQIVGFTLTDFTQHYTSKSSAWSVPMSSDASKAAVG